MDTITPRLEGPQPVSQIALDMLKRGLLAAPLLAIIGGAIWGLAGSSSVAYGLGLVLFNFWLSAFLIAYTSKISLSLLMAGVMGGFLLRLAIIFGAFWVVKDVGWINVVALGLTIIITHLGLIVWELKYISASLAHPGLKPKKSRLKPRKSIFKSKKSGLNSKKKLKNELKSEGLVNV